MWHSHSYAVDDVFLIYAPDAYAADVYIRTQSYSADADVHT